MGDWESGSWKVLGWDGIYGFIFMTTTILSSSATIWVRTATNMLISATKLVNRATNEFPTGNIKQFFYEQLKVEGFYSERTSNASNRTSNGSTRTPDVSTRTSALPSRTPNHYTNYYRKYSHKTLPLFISSPLSQPPSKHKKTDQPSSRPVLR